MRTIPTMVTAAASSTSAWLRETLNSRNFRFDHAPHSEFVAEAPTINFKLLILFAVLWSACFPVEISHAKAHCFCKLGPVGSPFHDFGQIKSYGTQIGHDSDCKSACNSTASAYMSDPANKAAVCAAAAGGNVVTYSAVGTRPYIAGSSLTCPSSAGGMPGKILFGTIPGVISRSVTVNLVVVNLYVQNQMVNVPIKSSFTSFVLNDYLSLHMQAWTYDAILYRDGVKIEQFSKKSPVAFQGNVYVQFTDQPNSFVHGHDWKVEWHYAGPSFQNGSVIFHIP